MEKFAVGVDLGGTKISAGIVGLSSGRLLGTAKKKTRSAREQNDILKRIIAVVDECLQDSGQDVKNAAGIGIGAAGMIDQEQGIILLAPNLRVSDFPVAEPLARHYAVSCRLTNDLHAATYGELHFGAGRACDQFVCVFAGTGIGSGIVNSGRLLMGASASAGEIGHIVVMPDGRECGCGGFGCLETYASRTAIAKSIMHELEKGADSIVRDKVEFQKGILRSKVLASAVANGDRVVTSAVTDAARYLGIGLSTIINFLNPQRIILGGGLVEAIDLYFEIAVEHARKQSLKIAARNVEIVRAELGDYAGIIGAALLLK